MPQAEVKGRNKRLKNVKNVFSLSSDTSMSLHPNIFLFDDIFTTGATLREAARMLKQGGAKLVWGVTIAR